MNTSRSSSEVNRRAHPESICSTRPRKHADPAAVSCVNWTTNDLETGSKVLPPGPGPARSSSTGVKLARSAGRVLKVRRNISEISPAGEVQAPSLPSSIRAAFRSAVSSPSVNTSYRGASVARASAFRPRSPR